VSASAGHAFSLAVSVCICTRNRAPELLLALESISNSSLDPVQVVVSDDGDDDSVAALLADQELPITYVRGPRTGLGANRNSAIDAATGDYLLFLDDDAALGEDFLATVARDLAELSPERAVQTIVTGVEINRGQKVRPNEQDMLGFQSRPYRPGERLRTVVINATLFPREVFERVRFDPSLAYGFDEVDFTTRACAAGFEIVTCFEAANFHNPSPSGRDGYNGLASASRLYVTFKRRRWTERSRLRAWVGAAVAGGHVYLAAVKRRGLSGLGEASRTIGQARGYYRAYLSSRANAGGLS
jgi:glycosyltransferase involved in cell wall biosynthesis